MPFIPRAVTERVDVQEIFGKNSDTILEKVAVSNLIGLLNQLNTVSKLAADIMGELLEETTQKTKRIDTVRDRIAKLDAQVPGIENMFIQNSPAFFYDNPYMGHEWKRQEYPTGGLFQRSRAPRAVNIARDSAEPVPDLSSLDPYNNDKPCVKMFSDREFFMKVWLESEQIKCEEKERKKIERKAARKKKKVKRQETRKIEVVKKKKFDVYGVEIKDTGQNDYIDVKQFDLPTETTFPDNRKSPPPQIISDNQHKIMQPRNSNEKTNESVSGPNVSTVPKVNLIPNSSTTYQQSPGRNFARPNSSPASNVPPPLSASNKNSNPPPMPPKPSIPEKYSRMLKVGIAKQSIINEMIKDNVDSSIIDSFENEDNPTLSSAPPIPSSSNLTISGVPPQVNTISEQSSYQNARQNPTRMMQNPAMMMQNPAMRQAMQPKRAQVPGPRRSALLGAIEKERNLRHVEPDSIEKKPAGERDQMLSAIRDGLKLRRVQNVPQKPKEEDENSSIFKILQRRQYLAEETDDESGSSDDGWDD